MGFLLGAFSQGVEPSFAGGEGRRCTISWKGIPGNRPDLGKRSSL